MAGHRQLQLTVLFLVSCTAAVLFFMISTQLNYYQVPIPENSLSASDMPQVAVFDFRNGSRDTIAHAVEPLITIAIGLGISTRKMSINKDHPEEDQVKKMPFLKDFLPSFCLTYSLDFSYHFYIAYDYNDPFLAQSSNVEMFVKLYEMILREKCKVWPHNVTFVKVNYSKKPAWAQNDAMIRAYLDHHEYYYRINDDTILVTLNWQREFVKVLQTYDPKLVGVVGPSFRMGNTGILTYDFVHRTHVDMFGVYYPRVFEGWHADRWISDVYKPGRSTKHTGIWIKHIESLGQRYPSHRLQRDRVTGVVQDHKEFMYRYLEHRSTTPVEPRKSHVISFSLDRLTEATLHGLLRNVVLAKQYFPGWTARLSIGPNATIPEPFARKLELEGLTIKRIDTATPIPSELLRHLVVDDETVEYFLIRDTRTRISPRDMVTVQEWLESGKGVHCVFDYPSIDTTVFNPQHWGGKRETVGELLQKQKMEDVIAKACKTDCKESVIFADVLRLDAIKDQIFCHDSISCLKEGYRHDISVKRFHREFLGQTFDWCEIPESSFPKDFSKKC